MHLSEFLCRDCTLADMKAATKDDVLWELAKAATGAGLDKEAVHAILLERERLGSTAVGNGCAIPHGKMSGLSQMVLTFARSREGVAFAAPDNKPCVFFFMVLAPEGAAGLHLGLLGSIARLAKDTSFKNRLSHAKTVDELNAFLLSA